MKKDFEDQIIAIAEISKNNVANDTTKLRKEDINFLNAIEQLYVISYEAVKIFNSNSDDIILSAYKLPNEFLEMFLEIPGRRGGFCIISPSKIIILFDEDPDLITVIGKKRKLQSSSNKTTQLLKVSFKGDKGEYIYRDNTGGKLDPYDIVALLIKWIVS